MFILPLLLLLSPLADAYIRLQNSVLYDEVDFSGVDRVNTDMCAAGCKIYATLPVADEYTQIWQNIIIADPHTKKNTSVAALSRMFKQGSNEKGFIKMETTAAVTIFNTNANQESGPLSLWIVSANSPYFNTAEVYEPQYLNRTRAIAPAPITILSASAFTIYMRPGDASFLSKNAVLARAAGYDAIDRNGADNCYTLMDNDFDNSFEGFSLNSALLTLSFNTAKYPNSKVGFTGGSILSPDVYPSFPLTPTFITSAGFVCGSASNQVYRSSSLTRLYTYRLHTPANDEMALNFEVTVDTDEEHPLSINDGMSGLSKGFVGSFKTGTNKQEFNLKTNLAVVTFDSTNGKNFYGIRVSASEV